MLRGFIVYNAETGQISCGKILSGHTDLTEEYECYMNIGNRKQMWLYKKGMQRDSMCIFSGTLKNGQEGTQLEVIISNRKLL